MNINNQFTHPEKLISSNIIIPISFVCFVVWLLIRMDNVSTGIEKKKKRKNKTTQQFVPSTERKASGCNWEIYKSLFSKTEGSNEEKKTPLQNKHPKSKSRLCNIPIHISKPLQTNSPVKEATEKETTKRDTVKTKENQTLTKQIAIDCEMVGIGNGTESMLARVSIVNRHGCCLYDKYVKPREKIVDYRTAVSGIRPEQLQNGENFTIVQKEVADILRGRVLVGHALKHDLAVLYLSHPRKYLRDSSRYKPFRQISKGKTPSLKKLAHELLGTEIQEGEHNSVEDARTAMQLYMLYKNKWEMERRGR